MRKWITLIEQFDDFSDVSEEARAELRALSAEAEANNCTLDLEVGIDSINLVMIERRHGAPKGMGAQFMQKLCEIADRYDLMIHLAVAGGMRILVSYYEGFGFEVDVDEENEDNHHPDSDEDSFGYEVPMFRDPR